jgi:hypothetical protein
MRSRVLALSILTALGVAGCDRGPSPASDASRTPGSTVQPTPSTAAASTPMPVSPSGLTNPSTAAMGNDLSNSTRASGSSNVYQPPSADNPASGAAISASPAPAASQSTSSQTRGTSPPPSSGTLPSGTEGNSGSARGGGKG